MWLDCKYKEKNKCQMIIIFIKRENKEVRVRVLICIHLMSKEVSC